MSSSLRIVLAGAVIVGALVNTTSANASTWVGNGANQIAFWSDANISHDLQVWSSPVSIQDRRWYQADLPPTAGTGAQLADRVWQDVAENAVQLASDPEDPTGSKLESYWTSAENALAAAFGGIVLPPDVQKALHEYKTAVRAALTKLEQAIAEHVQPLREMVADLAKVNPPAEKARLWSQRLMVHQATLNEVLRDVENNLIETVRSAEAKLNAAAAGMPPEVKKEIKRIVSRVRWRVLGAARGSNKAGFASLGLVSLAAQASILALAWNLLPEVESHKTIVMRDINEPAMVAYGTCKKVVRDPNGGRLVNSIACPAPTSEVDAFEMLGNLFGGSPQPALHVLSGTKDDTIRLQKLNASSGLQQVYVQAGAGNDQVSGSDIDDLIAAGPGNDTVLAHKGHDVLYGANQLINFGVTPSQDNDRLFGQDDADVIKGDVGNDLIAGGRGDDADFHNAALSGGAGNDVVIGGSGIDDLDGGPGRNILLAGESGLGRQDELDHIIDCGETSTSAPSFVTLSSTLDLDGIPEQQANCAGNPPILPTVNELLTVQPPADGRWRWLG